MRATLSRKTPSSGCGGWRSPQPSPAMRRAAARKRTPKRAARLAELTPLSRHLPEDGRDHPQRRELGGPAGAREVVEAELDHHRPRLARAQQQLGIDEAALALELDALEERPAEELEGEVHVADAQAEEQADEEVVADGVQRAVQTLRRAVEAIAGEEVRLLVLEQPHGPRQLPEVDRQVGVGVEDQILRGRGVTGAQRAPEAAVDGVV